MDQSHPGSPRHVHSAIVSAPKDQTPSLVQLEQSEAKGTIELRTLRRVAEALDCTVVYALVPNKPLETMVRDGARAFARKRREYVEHTMLLENQKVASKNLEAQLDEIIREKNPRLFWD
jgi:predicted DNA-binding mobile mystery protein A